jgi:NADH-quinone oxidoreductase subunit L
MDYAKLIFLIPILPLVGFLINGFLGGHLRRKTIGMVACCMPILAFAVSLTLFIQLVRADYTPLHQTLFPWIGVGSLGVSFGFAVDTLSCAMILMITGVGSLIHIYATGYMSHDRSPERFFAYLNLFMFAMLILVLADNVLLMFVGWEGVGLCSYLLIGYWYEDILNAKAGKKAFITNRVGDFGFLLGIFLIFTLLYSANLDLRPGEGLLDFAVINEHLPDLASTSYSVPIIGGTIGATTLICLLLFLGATGKSAQIPLYVWLPDAMAGPTPVSALIHAATMVTSGVYMIARLSPVFATSQTACAVVATIGACTALFAATIAVTQNDIKKVLAYSTISQLGYMFLGVGVMAFSAGMFHLITHAFFKACLFLCAGSVMHACAGELNMQKMGGLRKKMPVTFATMLISTIAIAGWPLLAGFFSKDEILWKTLEHGIEVNAWFYVLYAIGLAAAVCTAFYMFRLIVLTFLGTSRMDPEVEGQVHESPRSMTVPLVILAFLAVVGGYMWLPGVIAHGEAQPFRDFLQKTLKVDYAAKEHRAGAEWISMIGSVILALGASGLSVLLYLRMRGTVERLAREVYLTRAIYRFSLNKYWVDEIYEALIIKPIYYVSIAMWLFVDVVIIDGLVNLAGVLVKWLSSVFRNLQTGFIGSYAVTILVGVLVVLWYLILQVLHVIKFDQVLK